MRRMEAIAHPGASWPVDTLNQNPGISDSEGFPTNTEGQMPYRARGAEVQEEVSEGQWKTIKTYSGSQKERKAIKYARRLNIEHARSKGIKIPEKK